MRKMKYVIGILLLFMVIGFATVSVSLSISGNAKILSDVDDFKVYFSDVKVNDVQDLTLVKSETELVFDIALEEIGSTYKISYDVTNASKVFDAALSINCTQGDETLSVNNEFDTSNLAALSTRTGILTIKKTKSNASETDTSYSITCSIVASPVERNSEASGEVLSPLQSLVAISEDKVESFYPSANVWETTGEIIEPIFLSNPIGTIEEQRLFNVGDSIKIKNNSCYTQNNSNEGIYVLDNEGWKLKDGSLNWCESNTSDFVASYPETASYNSFSLITNYTDETNGLSGGDWMTGYYTYTKGDDKSLAIELKRMLSRIVVTNVSFNSQYDPNFVDVMDIKIYSLNSTLEYDGTTLSGDKTSVGISAYHLGDTWVALISPGKYDDNQKIMTVTLVIDGVDIVEHDIFAGDLTMPSDGFKSGFSYEVEVVIGDDVVNDVSFTIKQWSGAIGDNIVGYVDQDVLPERLFVTNNSRIDYNQATYVMEPDSGNYITSDLLLWEKGENIFSASNFNNSIFSITSDQSIADGIKSADWLVAKYTGTQSDGQVNFEMRHNLSYITINITIDIEESTNPIYDLIFYSSNSTLTFDGTNLLGDGELLKVYPFAAVFTPGYGFCVSSYNAIVSPGTYNMTDIIMSGAVGDYSFDLTASELGLPSDGLESGVAYTFDVSISFDELMGV